MYKFLGLTAIEAWVIVCVLFVFGALAEYAGVLLKIKIAATRNSTYLHDRRGLESPMANSIVLANGNTILQDDYSVRMEVSNSYVKRMLNKGMYLQKIVCNNTLLLFQFSPILHGLFILPFYLLCNIKYRTNTVNILCTSNYM